MEHLVGVQEGQRIKRALMLDCEAEGVAAKLLMTLDEAMRRDWDQDAHYFQYHLTEPEEIPGVAKTVLPLIRDRGSDLLMDVASVDIDTDPHGDLTEAGFDNLLKLLVKLFETAAGLPYPSYFYTTKGGARLVWKLKESIPVDEAEPHMRGLLDKLAPYFPRGCGFAVDMSCWDWTRVFRLPKVTRDGKQTWEHPLFSLEEGKSYDQLDLRSIIPQGRKSEPINGDRLDLPLPTPEEVERYLRTGSKQTEWYKEAKKRLKGRECFPLCFDGDTIPEGDRDSGIQRHTGQAVGLLAHVSMASPEKVYALFYDSISQLTPDDQTEDWNYVLWKAILKYWGKEAARIREAEKKQKVEEKQTDDKLSKIVRFMQKWCDHPHLHNEDEDVRRLFALQHLICLCANEYLVMQSNGYYSPIGVTRPTDLPGLISRLGMDDLIQLSEMDGNNQSKPVPHSKLLQRHGTYVGRKPEARLGLDGFHIQDIDTEEAALLINLYKRKEDLYEDATWHPEVDRWLHALVAPADYSRLEGWIAHSLAFEEGPTAALSISGPPGIGKQLFVQGLAECIDTEEYASAREFGRFREKLLHTPFLCVNEGLPKGQDGVEDVADIFRHFVSGDALHIEVKGKSPVTVYNPLRVIFTANNMDVILALAGHRSLTKEDQAALLKRLVHIEARQNAADYLLGLGGRDYTGTTKHWVGGPEGPSRYVVAKHFMWIYKERRKLYPRGARFLVEGDQLSEFMDVMRTQIGHAPTVIEAMIELIEHKYQRGCTGLAMEGCRVYMTQFAIRKKLEERGIKIKQRTLQKTLAGLLNIKGSCPTVRKVPVTGTRKIAARWHEIDISLLHREAIRIGMPHEKMDELIAAQVVDAAELEVKRG